MVAVLKVWSNFSGKQLGTIEIGRNEPAKLGAVVRMAGLNGTSMAAPELDDHPVYGGPS